MRDCSCTFGTWNWRVMYDTTCFKYCNWYGPKNKNYNTERILHENGYKCFCETVNYLFIVDITPKWVSLTMLLNLVHFTCTSHVQYKATWDIHHRFVFSCITLWRWRTIGVWVFFFFLLPFLSLEQKTTWPNPPFCEAQQPKLAFFITREQVQMIKLHARTEVRGDYITPPCLFCIFVVRTWCCSDNSTHANTMNRQ